MTLATAQTVLLWFVLGVGVLLFISSLVVVNPYGRYMKRNQTGVPALQGWLLMESPQVVAFATTLFLVIWFGGGHFSKMVLFIFVLWQGHYIYRALIYPFRMRSRHKKFPHSGVIFGFVFNAINGFLNGAAVALAAHLHTAIWFDDPRFLIGFWTAVAGWGINFHADTVLINLRRDNKGDYHIPYGGLFRHVSAANYFGEILMWWGFALMTWTWAGLVFALFTTANLLPRGLSHHRWYLKKFPDYPKDRKAVIPKIL